MKYSDFMRGNVEKYRPTCANIARHEAGHALLASAVDYLPIKEVQIWRGSGRCWNGTVEFDSSCLDDGRAQDVADFYQRAVMVIIAGPLAVVPTLRGEELADAMSFLDCAVFALGMCNIADDITEDAILEELTIKTTGILEQHQAALGKLTRLLVRGRRLDAQDIAAVVSPECRQEAPCA